MARRSRIFLGLGALSGAVLTAWLVVHLLGADGQRGYARGEGRPMAEQREERRDGRGRVVQTVDDAYPDRGKGSGVSPSLIRPGGREPHDSPQTLARRAEQSAEVLRLLEKIRTAEDPSRNTAMFLELQKLVRQLGYRLPRTTRDQLVAMLDTVEPKWRPLIGKTLGNLRGDTETAGILMAKLEGRPDNTYTRRALLYALTNMDVPEVLPRLGKMLGTAFEEEHLVARAIGQIGGEKATETLLNYLERDPIRGQTAREIERILGAGADPKVLSKVEKGLESDSPTKRKSMLNVLAAARSEESAESIRELLENEADPSVRSAAIRALGQIGDPDSGQALLAMVEGGDAGQRSQAINAIHAIRNPKTVEQLAGEWNRLPDDAQYAVIGAAARLPRPPEKLVEIARDSAVSSNNERVRNAAVNVLGSTRDEKHAELIGSFLRGAKSRRERSVALQALRRIGTEKAAETALRHLGYLPERERESVRLQFEKIRDKRAAMREASERHR